MLRTVVLSSLFLAAGIPVFAGVPLFQGTLQQDDEVALIPFTLSFDSIVTIQSYGYAGGLAPDGTLVSAGGFAPNAILFDSTGAEFASDNGGHCSATGADPVTGNCDDPLITENLTAGMYTLALAVWDNAPNGDLGAGFRQDGNPGFTCADFGAGNFCDVTTALGTSRDGNYAVAISSDALAAVPEPSTSILFAALALALIAWRGFRTETARRFKHSESRPQPADFRQ